VDFHSETGLCFVVSNVQNRHTLVSVDMDIPQIVGRIRTKSNPFRNKVVHIFNTKATDHYTTFEEMEQIVDEEVKAAQERADMLNNAKLSEAATKQQVNEIKKVGVESYLSYQENKFIVNDMVAKLQLYSYYIATVVYQSDKSLRETYAQSGIVTTKGKWHIAPEKFVKELIVKPTFRELHKRYCEIKANPMTFDLQTIDIEHEYPILGRAYRGFVITRKGQPINGNGARIRLIETAQKLHQGRFSRAIDADDCQFLSRLECQRHIIQGFVFLPRVGETEMRKDHSQRQRHIQFFLPKNRLFL
jgi:hypothetical protein